MRIGVDEVGLGAWAGPMTICACAIEDGLVVGVRDSKTIAEERRYALADELMEKATAYKIAVMSHTFIDTNGLDAAWDKGVRTVIDEIRKELGDDTYAIVDGRMVPPGMQHVRPCVKGDKIIYQISAASIIAKASRDRQMRLYDAQYPGYQFAKHKGYGTKIHHAALQALGPCAIHRMTVKPVKNPAKPLPKEELEFDPARAQQIVDIVKNVKDNPYASDWEIVFVDDVAARLGRGDKLSPRQMFFLDAIRRRRFRHVT